MTLRAASRAFLYFPDSFEGWGRVPESKGHLNPGAAGIQFDRFELGPGLEELVRHVWVVRWELPAGEVSAQRVLAYPAFNAVFEPGRARLYPPDSRLSVRKLSGRSWAVGILFRPAAGPLLTSTPAGTIAADGEPIPGAPVESVDRIMASAGRDALVRALRGWLGPVAERVGDDGRLVNRACELAETDPALLRATELAARLAVSPRTLERLVRRHVGLTPKWLIECRRLQHAATTLFTAPHTDLSALAAELGYADYAHFSRQYERVLGETPHRTARQSAASRLRA
jgi:AraC-like DNA-binding protein